MTSCVEKIAHEECGSRDGLQVFLNPDGKYTGYCFSCSTFVADPYKDKPADYKPVKVGKTPEQIEKEIEDISQYQTLDLPERMLKKASLAYFDVKIGVSEKDGTTPEMHYYPYTKDGKLVGYKARLIADKRMWAIGSLKDVDLFGWEQAVAAGGKRLIVVEGECDAVALYQICKQANAGGAYAELNPAIVSLPSGAGSAAKSLAKALPEIRRKWKEIVLCFDKDDAGNEAVKATLKVIPDAKVAELPGKDANDCLLSGRSKAAYQALTFNAAAPKNTRLVQASSLHETARQPAKWGFSWPWKHLTDATRGIRFGETYYLGAAQKMGKSDVVNTLLAWFIKEHGWKVFAIKPEEANNKTYKMVAGKLVGKMFHDPKKEFDEAAYDRAGEIIGDKLYLLNLYQDLNWDVVMGDIRVAAQEGCKAVFIDPITNFANGMDAAAANVLLQKIAQDSAKLALDLDIVIFLTCHVRNPESGLPHELGGHVLSNQMAGSRAMARSCNLMLGLEGNRDPDLPKEARNVRTISILEDREFGENGKFKLYWDDATGLFNEI